MPQAYEGHNFNHALEVIILVASVISFLVSAAIIFYIAYYYKSDEKTDAQLIIRRSSLSSSSSSGELGIIKPGEDESVIEISEHLSFSKHPKTVQERRQLFLALSDLRSRKITTIREEGDDGDEENEEEHWGELPSVHSSCSSSPSIRYVDGQLVVRKKRNLGDSNEFNGEDMTIPGLSKSSSASSHLSQQSLNTPSSSCSSIRSTKRNGKYSKYRPNSNLTPQYLHLLSLQLLQQNQSPMSRHFPPQVYCNDLSAEDEKEEEERMRILLQSKEIPHQVSENRSVPMIEDQRIPDHHSNVAAIAKSLIDPDTRPLHCTSTFPDIYLPDEELYDV
jgi:hypothetical protein